MEITGATFNFTKKVSDEEEGGTPESPVDVEKENKPKSAGEKKKKDGDSKESGKSISAFAYDMIKQGIQTTVSSVLSNVSGSPTLQVQLQTAQQVGGKIIAYTAAAATGNWAVLTMMAFSDAVSYISKTTEFNRQKAWSDYDIEQYQERRGYSSSRNRY